MNAPIQSYEITLQNQRTSAGIDSRACAVHALPRGALHRRPRQPLTGRRGNLLLDVVFVLGTEDADDDATASGCCLSHGEYGVVRARRTASRMAENDGGEHHPHPPILISHTVRVPVVFAWLQVTWAPTDTNQGTSGHLQVTTRGRGVGGVGGGGGARPRSGRRRRA